MKSIFVFFSCLTFFVTHAQEVIILDETTNDPISGVVIYNSSKTKSFISDINGKVSLDFFTDNEEIIFQHISHIKLTYFKSEIPRVIYLSTKSQDLDEVVVSASKFEQSKREVPQKIISIKARDVLFSNPQTSADLLQNSGQVFIQKSQLGGGSPLIRGFSTNRLLLSVDDVRMNNAIFRGGNVQNVISIDPFAIQNTEIILGSGSVIYGSDAIGGVMNFYTRKPRLSESDSLFFKGNAILRYSSASKEKTEHLDFNFGFKKWAFLTSVSFTDFEDLKMGTNGPDDYLRQEYVNTVNGLDIIMQNESPRIQKNTGYNQINFLEKIHYKASETLSFDLGLHYSATSDYPRYDRLLRYNEDELKSAEWFYGPQRWFLGNFQITKYSSNSNLYDKIKATVAFQNFQESRNDRDLYSEIRRTREENVDAISANLDFEKSLSETSKLFYGAEYIYNTIGSKGEEENIIIDNTKQQIASRYPNGSTWQSLAAYMSYKFKPNKKFTLQSGIRYNAIFINADLNDNNAFLNLPFRDANINTGAVTGTAGISWIPNKTLQWKFNASTAFRAPNIDDIGKIFDSEPGSVVVPNANLKPEYAYGAELGLTLNFNETVIIDLNTYYTYLDNALVRRDFNINGETEIIYDGELSNVQAIQNASKAWIYGFEAGIKINFSEYFKLSSQCSVVDGTEKDEGIEVPIRHVAPSFGNTHFIWEMNKVKLDAYLDYNGELSFNQLAPSEIEKTYIYAKDKNGNPYSPSWYTLNFRSQYQINKQASIIATIENITNQLYRPYSSGISAPGINFILTLKYSL